MEARALTTKARESMAPQAIEDALRAIHEAATRGDVFVHLSFNRIAEVELVTEALRARGFLVGPPSERPGWSTTKDKAAIEVSW